MSTNQILATGRSVEEKTNSGTCIQEAEVAFKNEPHSLFEKENEANMKDKFLKFDNNINNESHFEVVYIKCEPTPVDFVHEDSNYSNSNSEHNSTNSQENFSCSVCNKKFRYKSTMLVHESTHTGIKNFECTICKKKFTLKTNLTSHQKIHIGIKKFECPICAKKFIIKSHLIRHERIHRGIKDFECSFCKKRFIQKSTLSAHEKIHSDSKNFECSVCKKRFTQKFCLFIHEKKHTNLHHEPARLTDLNCQKTLQAINSNECHYESTRNDSAVSVSSAEDMLQEDGNYSDGYSTKHNSSNSDANFSCSICNKKFRFKSTMLLHESTHAGIKNFECSICKKKFMYNCNRRQHEKIHSDIKSFECLICNKKFLQNVYLKQHQKIHSDIKNFECTVCNKKFITNSALKKHTNIHTDIKSFECTICRKKFKNKYSWIQHEKHHTNIKKCHSVFEEENDIVVKGESVAAEDNADIKFYQQYVKSIKYEFDGCAK